MKAFARRDINSTNFRTRPSPRFQKRISFSRPPKFPFSPGLVKFPPPSHSPHSPLRRRYSFRAFAPFAPSRPKNGICAPYATVSVPLISQFSFIAIKIFCSFIAGSFRSRFFGAALDSHNPYRRMIEPGGVGTARSEPAAPSRLDFDLISEFPPKIRAISFEFRPHFGNPPPELRALAFEFRPYL